MHVSPESPTLTDQNGWIVEKVVDGLPSYFSPRVGRNLGNPSGGWSSDPAEALRFAREQDVSEFLATFVQHEAPFCKPVQLQNREAAHA